MEKYDSACKAMYIGENGTVRLITDNRVPAIIAQKQIFGNLWMLIAPIIIWCIWMARSTKVFSANKRPLAESIKLIWHTPITTLRLNFRKCWCTTPMAAKNGMDIQWQYVVPRWLFPPPISWKRGVNKMSCEILNAGDVYERLARDTCESVR